MEHFAIDGNNVCWWYGQAFQEEISIKPLFAVIEAILDNRDDFYCVFDASIYYKLEECGKVNEKDILTQLVHEFPDNFFIVTASSRADGVVLHDADYNNSRIITNDIYRDYIDKYSWLSDKYTPRLIQGNFHRNGLLTMDKLAYGQLKISEDIKKQADNIINRLTVKHSPEIESLEAEISNKQKILADLQNEIKDKKNILSDITDQINSCDKNEKKSNKLEQKINKLQEKQAVLKEKQVEIKEQNKQLKHENAILEERIQKAGFILDFDETYKDRCDQLHNVETAIIDKMYEQQEIENKNKSLANKYKNYTNTLNQTKEYEKAEKLKASNEQECIKNARIALHDFVESYGVHNSLFSYDFSGSTWDNAVHALKISFMKEPVCQDCYERSTYDNIHCTYCNGTNRTKNPTKIWNIINQYAPKK